MITAKEAREVSNKVIENSLENVFRIIDEESRKGKTEVSLDIGIDFISEDGLLFEDKFQFLREIGYTVNDTFDCEDTTIIVSW